MGGFRFLDSYFGFVLLSGAKITVLCLIMTVNRTNKSGLNWTEIRSRFKFLYLLLAFGFVVIDYPVLLSPAKMILSGGGNAFIMSGNLF